MNKKVFTATAVAAVAAVAGVAVETRPVPASSVTTAQTQPTPSVETVVIQRTVHVRKRIKRKRHTPRKSAAAVQSAAPVYRPQVQPIAVRTAPVAPRVKTSPSSTGGGEREHGDGGESRDD